MGDGFEYRLSSQSIGAYPPPEGSTAFPWGFRPTPSARLNIGNFFADFRLEGFAGYDPTTPLGGHYFDASPSSTISDRSPASAWVYTPSSDKDNLRGYFGIRQFTLGYHFTPDLQLRIGRTRYDQTESDRLMMANAYTWQTQFADLVIPLHWLGAELRYDRVRPSDTLRQLLFSAAAWNGAGDSWMGMGQGLASFAFSDASDAPRLTATAYAAFRHNAQPATGPALSDPGNSHGEGLALQFDYGIFTSALAFSHSGNTSHDAGGLQLLDNRDIASLMLDFHPGNWRFRGVASFLNQAKASDLVAAPAHGLSEFDTELTVNYRIVEGLVASLGYRGVYGEGQSNHMGFLGLTTSFQGSIPFSSSR